MIVESFPLHEVPTWDKMLQDFPEQATVFHTSEWMETLQLAFGYEPRILLALGDDEGSYFAGLPYMIDRRYGIDNYLSMPLDTYGGAVGNLVCANSLANDFLFLPGIGVRYCVEFNRFGENTTELVNISPDLNTLWKSFSNKTRNAIRSAEKHNVIIDTPIRYYNLFDKVPDALEEAITKHMIPCNLCRQFVSFVGVELAAASLFFFYGNTATYWANTVTDTGRRTNANYLLMWTAIQYAKEHGCTILNLGESPAGADSLVRFKRAWGSTPYSYSKRQESSLLLKPILKIREAL